MDLLGSIMKSMDKSKPKVTEADKKHFQERKRHEAEWKNHQEEAKKKLKEFRHKIEKQVAEFIQDDAKTEFKFKPMNHVQRSIVKDVADVAGLLSYSFGEEGVDRYAILYKVGHSPNDNQLLALRGMAIPFEKSCSAESKSTTKKKSIVPAMDYRSKYERLLGKDDQLTVIKAGENQKYGFVPSENKRDVRSIEQTLADIREKKRRRIDDNSVVE